MTTRQAEIEAAFREGYTEGYKIGQDDYGRFECGGGSRTIKGQKDDQDSAWDDSDCKGRSDSIYPKSVDTDTAST